MEKTKTAKVAAEARCGCDKHDCACGCDEGMDCSCANDGCACCE